MNILWNSKWINPAIVLLLAAIMQTAFPSNTMAHRLPHHLLAIDFDLESGTMTGKSTFSLAADQTHRIYLDKLQITSVVLNSQLLADFPSTDDVQSTDHDALVISPQPMEQQLVIEFHLNTAPGDPANLISPAGICLTGIWHPLLLSKAFYSLEARIPATFSGIAEADEISENISGDIKTVRLQTPLAFENISFIAGPYQVEKTSFSSGKQLFSYFFSEDSHLAQSYRDKARDYLTEYEEKFGPYPFQRFSIVENRLPTGYAMPTFTLLGQAVVNLPFIKDISLRHEVLHSWFGNGVLIDNSQGNWVEGLATYLADYQHAIEHNEALTFRKKQLMEYASYVPRNNPTALEAFHGGISPGTANHQIRAIGYSKAYMVFHMLEKQIGQESFSRGLRLFYQSFLFKNANWENLAGSFEQASETRLQDFFHQWLRRSDLPDVSATGIKSVEKDGQPVVLFTIRQQTENPYSLSVPVVIKTEKQTFSQNYSISELSTAVEIPLDSLPLSLTIDPEYHLMRQLGNDELPPVWSRFAGAENKIAFVADRDAAEIFAPFIEQLKSMGTRVLMAENATDQDLQENSVIFLGAAGRLSQSIFAVIDHPSTGFTVDVRTNPLNTSQVMVLASSSRPEETSKAMRKLQHYGKYSFLQFKNGRISRQEIKAAENGLIYQFETLPQGIPTATALDFEEIVHRLQDNQVIYCGELHTNYQDHKMQLHIIRKLYDRNASLAIALEMFDEESQPALDAYVAGAIDLRQFLNDSQYFSRWGYDFRLYREILEFARKQQIPLIALNLNKEIVSKIFKEGSLAVLGQENQDRIPVDRDLGMEGYLARIGQAFQMHRHQPGIGSLTNFLQAQATWDETMAATIAATLSAHPERQLVVLAGAGHVDKKNGIPPRVSRRLPVKQAVVINGNAQEINQETADYVIFMPEETLPKAALMGVMLKQLEHNVGILDTTPHSSAGKADIRKDDIILALDDKKVETIDDIKIIMYFKNPGDPLIVRLRRKGFFFSDTVIDVELKL